MKRKLFVACALVVAISASAQSNVGYGLDLDGDIKLTKKLHLDVNAEVRSQDGMSELERLSVGAGLSYKINKYVKADAGYLALFRHFPVSYTSKGNMIDSSWSPRHRAFVGAKGEIGVGRFSFSLRERFQYTHTNEVSVAKYQTKEGGDGHRMDDKVYPASDEYMLRSRIGVEYDIHKCPVTPYATVEMFNDFDNSMKIDQMRYIVGASWRIDKHNSLDLSYRYKNKNDDDDEPGSHLISIGYSHSF